MKKILSFESFNYCNLVSEKNMKIKNQWPFINPIALRVTQTQRVLATLKSECNMVNKVMH